MTTISNNIRMYVCGAAFLVANCWVKLTVVSEYLEDLKSLIMLNILK